MPGYYGMSVILVGEALETSNHDAQEVEEEGTKVGEDDANGALSSVNAITLYKTIIADLQQRCNGYTSPHYKP